MTYNILRKDIMRQFNSEDLITSLGLFKKHPTGGLLDARFVRRDETKSKVFILCSLLSAGLLPLACIYHPVLKTKLTKVDCDPSDSDSVIVSLDKKEYSVPTEIHFIESRLFIFVEINCKRYFTSPEQYFRLDPLNDAPMKFFKQFISAERSQNFGELYKTFYGLNVMTLPKANVWDILLVQLLSPFFVFQYFAFIVWMVEEYWAFAVIILIITFVSIYLNTMEQLFNLRRLHDLAGKSDMIDCLDDITGEYRLELDSELYPGCYFRVSKGTRVFLRHSAI